MQANSLGEKDRLIIIHHHDNAALTSSQSTNVIKTRKQNEKLASQLKENYI